MNNNNDDITGGRLREGIFYLSYDLVGTVASVALKIAASRPGHRATKWVVASYETPL